MTAVTPSSPVLLFDGVCSLCNGVVDFVMRHERRGLPPLAFAALQSESARTLLDDRVGPERSRSLRAERAEGGHGDPGSVVLIVGDRVYERSTAALHLARYLRWPWQAARLGWVLPRPGRDLLYEWVARHRYAWFGKKDACRIPTPEERARFLP